MIMSDQCRGYRKLLEIEEGKYNHRTVNQKNVKKGTRIWECRRNLRKRNNVFVKKDRCFLVSGVKLKEAIIGTFKLYLRFYASECPTCVWRYYCCPRFARVSLEKGKKCVG
jgi:hypothetical protein